MNPLNVASSINGTMSRGRGLHRPRHHDPRRCRLQSPIVHTPQRGKAITINICRRRHDAPKSEPEFVGEWSGDKSVIVEFKSEIEGIAINGIE
jgi:hypothetical protein